MIGRIWTPYLDRAKEALIKEGFRDTPLQVWKPGQVFGLVKPLDDVNEVHVRGYQDGTLDAEIEVSREYLEHLVYGSYPYDHYFMEILKRHNIPHKVVKPIESAQKPPKPATLIPWKPLLLIAAVVGVIAFIASTSSSDGDKEESRRR
jgi:hypothetical protein